MSATPRVDALAEMIQQERRCPAYYDKVKQCALAKGHDGKHRASWTQSMVFDHDYRDPAASDQLD